MKVLRKITALLLSLVALLSLCACGNKTANDDNAAATTTTTTNAMGGNLEGENVYNDAVFGEW